MRKSQRIIAFLIFIVTLFSLVGPIVLDALGIEDDDDKQGMKYVSVLACPLMEEYHAHELSCYNDENLVCGYSNVIYHEHDELCYNSNGELECTLPDNYVHQHNEGCIKEFERLVCDLEEDDHEHTEECYETQFRFDCDEKIPTHQHDENCFILVEKSSPFSELPKGDINLNVSSEGCAGAEFMFEIKLDGELIDPDMTCHLKYANRDVYADENGCISVQAGDTLSILNVDEGTEYEIREVGKSRVMYNVSFDVNSDGASIVSETKDDISRAIIKGMTLEEKVGQMFMVWGGGSLAVTSNSDIEKWMINEIKPGGILLFAQDFTNNASDEASMPSKDSVQSGIQRAQNLSMTNTGIPLLVAVDEEGSNGVANSAGYVSVVRVSQNPKLIDTSYPYLIENDNNKVNRPWQKLFMNPRVLLENYGVSNPNILYEDALHRAAELQSLGINVNFAPVADVCSSGAIFARSIADDANTGIPRIQQIAAGYKEAKLGNSMKHWPGYGSNSGDTHNGSVISYATEAQLKANDMRTFIAGLEAGEGLSSVMVTHNIYQSIDPVYPASLSYELITRILRGDYGFDGVVMTDALNMGAVADNFTPEQYCVKSIEAGNDLLLVSHSAAVNAVRRGYNSVVSAVEGGTLSLSRIEDSNRRLLNWKQTMELIGYSGSCISGEVKKQANGTYNANLTIYNTEVSLPIREDNEYEGPSITSDYSITFSINDYTTVDYIGRTPTYSLYIKQIVSYINEPKYIPSDGFCLLVDSSGNTVSTIGFDENGYTEIFSPEYKVVIPIDTAGAYQVTLSQDYGSQKATTICGKVNLYEENPSEECVLNINYNNFVRDIPVSIVPVGFESSAMLDFSLTLNGSPIPMNTPYYVDGMQRSVVNEGFVRAPIGSEIKLKNVMYGTTINLLCTNPPENTKLEYNLSSSGTTRKFNDSIEFCVFHDTYSITANVIDTSAEADICNIHIENEFDDAVSKRMFSYKISGLPLPVGTIYWVTTPDGITTERTISTANIITMRGIDSADIKVYANDAPTISVEATSIPDYFSVDGSNPIELEYDREVDAVFRIASSTFTSFTIHQANGVLDEEENKKTVVNATHGTMGSEIGDGDMFYWYGITVKNLNGRYYVTKILNAIDPSITEPEDRYSLYGYLVPQDGFILYVYNDSENIGDIADIQIGDTVSSDDPDFISNLENNLAYDENGYINLYFAHTGLNIPEDPTYNPDNPRFQVQYYGNIRVPVMHTDGEIAGVTENTGRTIEYSPSWNDNFNLTKSGLRYITLINTHDDATGAHLPINGTGHSVGRAGNPWISGPTEGLVDQPFYYINVTSDGSLEYTTQMTQLFKNKQYQYRDLRHGILSNVDVMQENSDGYYVYQIVRLKPGVEPDTKNPDDWDVIRQFSEGDDVPYIRMTTNPEETENILVDTGDVFRFIYNPKTSIQDNNADFYDYNVTEDGVTESPMTGSTLNSGHGNGNGIISALFYYISDSASRSTLIDGIYQRGSGINNKANYKDLTKTPLGFGNANAGTSTGLAYYIEDGMNIYPNISNANTNPSGKTCTPSSASNYLGSVFGLASHLDTNGHIVYNNDISVPSLFDEDDGEAVIGKYTAPADGDENYGLVFNRVGNSYILESVYKGNTNAEGYPVLSNLSKFVYPGNYTQNRLLTNNFWPLDGLDTVYRSDRINWGESEATLTGYSKGNYFGNELATSLLTPASDDGQAHNSYFGMHYKVNFSVSSDYVGPLDYFFFGDDDLWVFLSPCDDNGNITGEGQLVCDIGGVHFTVGEYVNLWDYVKFNEGEKIKNYVLSVFYTERGASGSTCYMRYTLPNANVTKLYEEDDAAGDILVHKSLYVEDEDNNPVDYIGNQSYKYRVLNAETGETILKNTFYEIYDDNIYGHLVGADRTDANGIFEIRNNEYALFMDVECKSVIIEELIPVENHDIIYNGTKVDGNEITGRPVTISGNEYIAISSSEKLLSTTQDSDFRYSNHLDGTVLASLDIQKKVYALDTDNIDKTRVYDINVYIDNAPLPVGTTYYVSGIGHTVTTPGVVSLKHDERAFIPDILIGSRFTVVEDDTSAEGFVTKYGNVVSAECTYDGAAGETQFDENGSIVHIIVANITEDYIEENDEPDIIHGSKMPSTGGSGSAQLVMFTGFAILAVGLSMPVVKKKHS